MSDRQPQCPTCRFNELRRYLLAEQWTESRGCSRQLAWFPTAIDCPLYEREPGADDEPRG